MMYEIEIINKKTNEVITVETDLFKREYCRGRLGHKHDDKLLLSIGVPDGKRFKWYDKYGYNVIVREATTGRRIETLVS